jgi:energy-coupling factor transport system ATP-binding protein
LIKLRNFSVYYGTISALKGISLDIRERECVVVTGPSGCGKSTLALALCGLIPHSIPATLEGQIEVAGMDPRTYTTPEIAQRVGIVFQRPATQLFHLRVDQEVAFGARNLGLSADEVRERTEWALEVTGIQKLRDRRPDEISCGQK